MQCTVSPFNRCGKGTGWLLTSPICYTDAAQTRTCSAHGPGFLSIRPGSPFERASLILTLRLMWTLRETALCPRVVPASMRGLSQKWLRQHQSPKQSPAPGESTAGPPRGGRWSTPWTRPGPKAARLLLLRSARRRIPVVMCPAPLVALPGGPGSWCAGTLTRRQPPRTLSWPPVPPLWKLV